jgi:hypothetical protein
MRASGSSFAKTIMRVVARREHNFAPNCIVDIVSRESSGGIFMRALFVRIGTSRTFLMLAFVTVITGYACLITRGLHNYGLRFVIPIWLAIFAAAEMIDRHDRLPGLWQWLRKQPAALARALSSGAGKVSVVAVNVARGSRGPHARQ